MRKIFLAFFLVALPLIIINAEECNFRKFLEFKYEHGKTYANASEEYQRCVVFTENSEMIENHNKKNCPKDKDAVTLGMNSFGDMTNKEFTAAYTGIPSQTPATTPQPTTEKPESSPHDHDHHRAKRAAANWTVPINFKPGSLNLTVASIPVRNQAQCGSCWTFSAAAVLEYYFYSKTGKVYDFAEQNFVDCARGTGYQSNGCNGGLPYEAINYARAKGLDFEATYPYRAITQSCTFKAITNGVNGITGANIPNLYTFPNTETALAYALYTFGWISVCINADALQFYTGGVYTTTQCKLGPNHAVVLVGYGVTATNVPYWILRNSWGPNWGAKGYFYLQRDVNACDIMNKFNSLRFYIAP